MIMRKLSVNNQNGTVLITVILVVAFVAILVVEINKTVVYQSNLNRNLMHRDQAYSYLKGMEEIAKIYLKKSFDAEEDDIVHLGQPWAQQGIAFPFDGGSMSATVRDMQSCLNLNSIAILDSGNQNLQNNQGVPTAARTPIANIGGKPRKSPTEEILTTLLEKILDDTEVRPSALSAQVRDWIDGDLTPTGPDGAEDLYYQGLQIPYLPANGSIAHVSELRAIGSFDRLSYEKIKPFVCALPDGEDNQLNINTIPVEHSDLLYAALGGKVTASQAKSLISERPESGYDLQGFWDQVGKEAKIKTSLRDRIDVTSRYFQVDAVAEIHSTKVYLKTLFIKETDNSFKVVSRYFGRE